MRLNVKSTTSSPKISLWLVTKLRIIILLTTQIRFNSLFGWQFSDQ